MPMVAFMCNKPSMYLSAKGWQRVEDVDCLHDPVDILNFCRRVYHDKQVTNVVESSKVTIGNWCQVNHPDCQHPEHTVTPYKCVVGPFQSEALLVPEHCVFDHLHDERSCQALSEWHETGSKACVSRGLALESSAPLSVCGVARFHGVEFVCCPAKTELKEKNELSKEDSDEKRENDVYNKYLHSVGGQLESEHDSFTRAKNDLTNVHKDKMSKVMKEWSAARQHVQELKQNDPKGAEKLEKEITERFQKTYSALTQELAAEKKQLANIHHQRVQANLNEKKRAAMDNYMDTLNDDESEASDILKALQSYIRVEQKDRLHTVNRYQHVLDTDIDEAKALRPQVVEHLKVVSKRIEQAINMLSRVPKMEKKIRVQIDGFMKDSFQEIDISVASIMAEPVEDLLKDNVLPVADSKKSEKFVEKPTSGNDLPLIGEAKHDPVVKKDGVQENVESPFDNTSQYDDDVDDDDSYDYDSYEEDDGLPVEEPKKEEVAAAETNTETDLVSNESEAEFDDETMEDEHALTEDTGAKASNLAAEHLGAEIPSITRRFKSMETSIGKGAVVGIIVATVTLFIVLVVGMAVLRKNSRHRSQSQLETDEDLSPEERHVAAMQVNGYENPTYKYFENKA